MKKIKVLIITVLMVLPVLYTSCSEDVINGILNGLETRNENLDEEDDTPELNGGDSEEICTISYVSSYGYCPSSKEVKSGYVLQKADLPELKTQRDYSKDCYAVFTGWNKKIGDVILGNTEITAIWTTTNGCTFTLSPDPKTEEIDEDTVVTIKSDIEGVKFYKLYRDNFGVNQRVYIENNSFVIGTKPDFTIEVMHPVDYHLNIKQDVYYKYKYYTIDFKSEYGTITDLNTEESFKKGEYAMLPPPIKRDGYFFKGWSNGDKIYSAGIPYAVRKTETLNAVFQKINVVEADDGLIYIKGGKVHGGSQNNIRNTISAFGENIDYEIKPFYMAKTPVTRRQYKAIMEGQKISTKKSYHTNFFTVELLSDPSYFRWDPEYFIPNEGEDEFETPVTSLYRCMAILYCNLLSEKEGLEPVYYIPSFENATITKDRLGEDLWQIEYLYYVEEDLSKNGYRLPTREEWEWAARGADPEDVCWNYAFPGIDVDINSDIDSRLNEENYEYLKNNLCYYAWTWEPERVVNGKKITNTLHQVGLKLPNILGLYDMAGNVTEMTDTLGSQNIGMGGNVQSSAVFEFYVSSAISAEQDITRDLGFRIVRNAN